jgi:hypothetical protein
MRRKGACVELADDQLMLSVDDAAIESVEARDGVYLDSTLMLGR